MVPWPGDGVLFRCTLYWKYVHNNMLPFRKFIILCPLKHEFRHVLSTKDKLFLLQYLKVISNTLFQALHLHSNDYLRETEYRKT